MKNVVQEFVINFSFSENYRGVLEHYARNENDLTQGGNQGRNLVNDFIEYLYQENSDAWSDEELSEHAEKIVEDFLEGIPNIYDEDIAKNIPLFWDWIEDFWEKENFYETMRNAQHRAYKEFLLNLLVRLLIHIDKHFK